MVPVYGKRKRGESTVGFRLRASARVGPLAPGVPAFLPVPGTVRFPVELTPSDGIDPARLETWPRVEGSAGVGGASSERTSVERSRKASALRALTTPARPRDSVWVNRLNQG